MPVMTPVFALQIDQRDRSSVMRRREHESVSLASRAPSADVHSM
jgi:hypothetical protein